MSGNGIKAGDCEAAKGAISCLEENLGPLKSRARSLFSQCDAAQLYHLYLFQKHFSYGIYKSANMNEKISV